MNFQTNMLPTRNRAWRSARFGEAKAKTASIVKLENSQPVFQLLTPHASNMLDPRNVVPFYELPVYRTTQLPALVADTRKQQIPGQFASPRPTR